MTDNLKRYERRSIRLHEYDYSLPGAYFITILSYQRNKIFGDVINGQMRLNDFGEIAQAEWFQTEKLRHYVTLYQDEMIIMPDHIHGIIWIEQIDNSSKGAATLRPCERADAAKQNVVSGSLGAIVRAYKAAVTYQINKLRNIPGAPVWHRNYYDHIIRNDQELQRIRDYINANPHNWHADS